MTMLVLTAAEMRELDRATIEGGHASGETLMERAGAGVVNAIERRYGPVLALRVAVLCGTGNNGGDGFVAARHLMGRGALVAVALAGRRDQVRGDAKLHLERLEAAGLHAEETPDERSIHAFLARFGHWDYALDALLGTGARGGPEGAIADAVQALRELDEQGTRVVAVDLPTGVNADSGEIARRAVRADLTVTFGASKRGHWLYPGRAFAGAVEVVDIGLAAPSDAARFPIGLGTAESLADLVPVRDPRAHKNSVGRVVVAGGSAGLTGAVALAARAATRAGAGYVRCAVPRSLADLYAVKLTEEMAVALPETRARSLAPEAEPEIAALAARADALVLGSGLSRHPLSASLARALVAARTCPVVLDADGLNAFEGGVPFGGGGAALVLTPHLGEMSRLTGESAPALEARRVDAAREWAMHWGVVVVLKGAPTVTAAPDGRATVNASGNPGLATAGTGDVLAGAIGALLAQGLGAYDAARLGVFAHGDAADRVAAVLGVPGLAASDVIEELPLALHALASRRDRALEERARHR